MMSKVPTQFRRNLLCTAVASVIACTQVVHAQQPGEAESDSDLSDAEIEELTVYGIRQSIEKSLDDKRFGSNIGDSINAEDIGKSTDQNIADALSRITGVTARNEDGEGTQISIRGANSQQNVIVLNGVEMSTTDFSQGVDLSAYSSDIIQKIVVIKSPSADHHEGALGGIVYMQSPKPLEMKKDARIVTLQGRHGDLAGENDYKLSTSFSETFFNDKLGILVTAFDEQYSVRRDQFNVSRYEPRTSRLATDPDGNTLTDVTGLVAQANQYQLQQTERDRKGIDVTTQWYAAPGTSLTFNVSYNEQHINRSVHIASQRIPDFDNMVEGQPVDGLTVIPDPSPWTDPQQDWHVYDPSNRTFTKYLNRFGLGDLMQSENEYDNENIIGRLNLWHQFSDTFTVSAGISRSVSERIPNQGVFVGMQNWANIGARNLWFTDPAELEPAGYDCTGGNCRIVAGTGFVDYGATTENLPGNQDLVDNRGTTGFNPDDVGAQHLSFMTRNVIAVEDERDSFNVDFDWEVDFAGINKLEFGFRRNTIDKYVDNQTGQFRAVEPGIVITDPETGGPIVTFAGLSDINADLFRNEGGLGVSAFMESLDYPRDNVTDGWNTFSAFRAFEVTQGARDVGFVPDDSETRSAELDNNAFYVKANFAFMDERLTGDIGVRYVETDVSTAGSSGVKFFADPANLGRVMDPFQILAHTDSSQPACSDLRFHGVDGNPENRWSRIDGQGWDTNGTPNDFTDDTRIAAEPDNCYWARADYTNPINDNGEIGWWWNWRFADVSTEAHYIYGDRPLDENGQPIVEDRSIRTFGVQGEHDYSEVLPSLNINFEINEEMILRFAASKTMSRPQIDSLRPGFRVQETVWGATQPRAGNSVTLFNTKLDPLESKNLDLSFEWYFAEGSMASIGLFSKDMSNFEESEQVVTYLDDLRGLGLDPNAPTYDPTNLIRAEDNLANCMPRRVLTFQLNTDWFRSGDPRELCAQFRVNRIRNGKGADIKGVELQYVQQYQNLPGFWSGLGVQLNYTYQDSSFDQEVSSIDSSVVLPELPVTYTPESSYNATLFWAQGGHQLRLSYQGSSDMLAQRSWNNGALWEEGRATIDFSAAYSVNNNLSITFDAVNITDEEVRTYFTSRFLDLGDVDGNGNPVLFDEGSPLEDGASKDRTVTLYKTGPLYRLGIRWNF